MLAALSANRVLRTRLRSVLPQLPVITQVLTATGLSVAFGSHPADLARHQCSCHPVLKMPLQQLPASCVDLPLDEKRLQEVAEQARDLAVARGHVMMQWSGGVSFVMVPLCLLPSPFPRKHFATARHLQTTVNLLLHRAAYDDEFLTSTLKSTIQVDPFTAQLFDIYENVVKSKQGKEYSLGLLRADYMLHKENEEPIDMKQVEVNTVSSAFAGLAPITCDIQRQVLTWLDCNDIIPNVPENNSAEMMSYGLFLAWQTYHNPKSVILFVIEDVTLNVIDQRHMEYALYDHSTDLKVIRCSFAQIAERGELKDGKLFVDGMEVAVVYFRTGYVPEQFQGKAWDVLRMIEESSAIKCPSVRYHLVGTKKVQQELSRPGVVEKFLEEPTLCEEIRKTFAKQWTLDLNEEGNEAARAAKEKPEAYVMKPQREGGGNNVYGADIRVLLEELGESQERQAYVLMQRLKQPSVKNYPLRGHGQEFKSNKPNDIVSELGTYGVVLGNKNHIAENFEAGFVLRSKLSGVNEGGIVAGFGIMDTPFLV